MAQLQKKSSVDVEFIADIDEGGTFTGYASVFGVKDSYGDVVHRGAFAESIKALGESGRKLPILWQHKQDQPIGFFTKLLEDDQGLYVEGKLLVDDVAQAKEAYALLKAGAVTGLSIGYLLGKHEYNEETKQLDIYGVTLKETSIVTIPANPESHVSSVKTGADVVKLDATYAILERIATKTALATLESVVSKLLTQEVKHD